MSTELTPSSPTVKRSNSYRKALRKSGVYYDPNDETNEPYQDDDDRWTSGPSTLEKRPIDSQPIGSKKRFVKRQQQQQQQQQRNILLSSTKTNNNNNGKPVDPDDDDPHEDDVTQMILMNANYPNGGGGGGAEQQQQQPNQFEDPLATTTTTKRQVDHFHMDTFQQLNERIVGNGRTFAMKNINKDPCDQKEEAEDDDDDDRGTKRSPSPPPLRTATTNGINWRHLICLFCCCNYCCCFICKNCRRRLFSWAQKPLRKSTKSYLAPNCVQNF